MVVSRSRCWNPNLGHRGIVLGIYKSCISVLCKIFKVHYKFLLDEILLTNSYGEKFLLENESPRVIVQRSHWVFQLLFYFSVYYSTFLFTFLLFNYFSTFLFIILLFSFLFYFSVYFSTFHFTFLLFSLLFMFTFVSESAK